MTITWCMVPETWSAPDRIYCHSRQFLPFHPPMDPENCNFGKMNNTTEDVIILQMSTINDSHISCHFGPFFALLPLLTT